MGNKISTKYSKAKNSETGQKISDGAKKGGKAVADGAKKGWAAVSSGFGKLVAKAKKKNQGALKDDE